MRGAATLALLVALALVGPAAAADYTGPLIDAHSHLPDATAIDAYVAAMKRHNVRKWCCSASAASSRTRRSGSTPP
jgi:hypothetical protein